MVKKTDKTEYYRNAGKRIKWPLNYNVVKFEGKIIHEKTISVPAAEWNEAKEDLMVRHLISEGFVLQDCIPQYNDVYDPEVKHNRPIPKEKPQNGFKCGDKFETSTGQRLEITSNINGLTLHYINVGKADIKTTIMQLEKSLDLGVWKRLEH